MAVIPSLSSKQVKTFMEAAVKEAEAAGKRGEVPIGAVIVKDGQIIASAGNRREEDQKTDAHAEMHAILKANEIMGSWRLEETALFVTLEPCLMCAGAILNARIPLVYFGAQDKKAGAVTSLYSVFDDDRLNHQVKVVPGVLKEESAALLKTFFQGLRAKQKAAKKALKESAARGFEKGAQAEK
ncbi:nucleoside deaminase [Fructobacillus sp. M1-13]|uniref:tRNA-specific adenosine deaminase n=1 Tax=Fructobacillus papyriferae TaxID=2713171 RepID=A0ABS5QPT5_9LACO|nr:nucleoside deaminase [Fructobacillus papyriferae]MBS9335199.1 nucleoside deaminase [Fructobacillus papyriferae]MCD2159132.1 nucleoside deaminase [Fructobacillus papyriferae]